MIKSLGWIRRGIRIIRMMLWKGALEKVFIWLLSQGGLQPQKLRSYLEKMEQEKLLLLGCFLDRIKKKKMLFLLYQLVINHNISRQSLKELLGIYYKLN